MTGCTFKVLGVPFALEIVARARRPRPEDLCVNNDHVNLIFNGQRLDLRGKTARRLLASISNVLNRCTILPQPVCFRFSNHTTMTYPFSGPGLPGRLPWSLILNPLLSQHPLSASPAPKTKKASSATFSCSIVLVELVQVDLSHQSSKSSPRLNEVNLDPLKEKAVGL